ncbi:MAG: HAMP domain-containing protein [Pseudomonadales bacterium]|nr:HAMP domain-containing protein [Pseudomonadales bacterium]
MLRTLYAKLAMVLSLLLIAIGAIYMAVSLSVTQQHNDEVSQRVSRDLAKNLIMDRNLVAQGQLDEGALRDTFNMYMVINPSIEIYLLDLKGKILSHSADPGKVKRTDVSLAPIDDFLEKNLYPLLGDDPRSHDRQKAFSVTPVPNAKNPEGYLYIVLQGEEYDSINEAVRESYLLWLSSWAVAGSLMFGLLAGLLLFYFLTRRLRHLTQMMERFKNSDFSEHKSYRNKIGDDALSEHHQKNIDTKSNDEIDRLGDTFDAMAQRIMAQLQAITEQDNNRRELIAQVSHDLRTPLASLRGYLETLKIKSGELSEEQQQRYIDISLRQSEHLTDLVGELFELATLDATEQLAHIEPFAVTELVHDVCQKFSLDLENKRISLEVTLEEGIPFVLGDIALIERVLENLLENAIRHTPEEGAINVVVKKENSQVSVSIRDTGIGIKTEELPRIFDRFYQAENAHREGQHVGLGLAIVKRVLELHQSTISVDSKSGQGAEFYFHLNAA